jgi:Protein of unknown function (DUF3109).
MFQIGDAIVASDIIEENFLCDLSACMGECCVEGDAGAPLEEDEVKIIEDLLSEVWDDLSPAAQAVIKKHGVAYRDHDGDMVTSIVHGKDCVFTYYDEKGICKCAIEKAYREGVPTFTNPSPAICTLSACKNIKTSPPLIIIGGRSAKRLYYSARRKD